jgi:hypothetical protein
MDGGRQVFPNHGFANCVASPDAVMSFRNGEVFLGVITVSDRTVVPLLEVYLQTLHIKMHGCLPVFNKQIG